MGFYYNEQRIKDIDDAVNEAVSKPDKSVLVAEPKKKSSLSTTGKSIDQLRREAQQRQKAQMEAKAKPKKAPLAKTELEEIQAKKQQLLKELEEKFGKKY